MSVRSFRSVFMVGGVAAAALSCYLVSLRVASERAALEGVESEIVLTQRDIRLLQTEIGTRGRLAQLERWNVKVLLLSAPTADQFVPDGFQLARMTTPEPKPAVDAPVVYASAPAAPAPSTLPPGEEQGRAAAPARRLMHEASLKAPAQKAAPPKATPAPSVVAKPKPAATKPPQTATAQKPAVAKPAPAKLAKADPLAPIPPAKKKPAPAAKPATASTAKDSGKTR